MTKSPRSGTGGDQTSSLYISVYVGIKTLPQQLDFHGSKEQSPDKLGCTERERYSCSGSENNTGLFKGDVHPVAITLVITTSDTTVTLALFPIFLLHGLGFPT